MTKLEQVVAIDLGNGTTSFIAGNGVRGSYASLAAPFVGSKAAEGFNRNIFKLKSGQQFLVGDDCREEGAASRSTDSSYYKGTIIQVLFIRALREAGIKNPFIVSGLPTEFFDSQRPEFEKNLRAWAIEEGFQPAGVVVLPQYVGALFDPELLDESGKQVPADLIAHGKFGIIDIGYGTTDVGQIVDGKGSKHKTGKSEGVSNFHKELLKELSAPEKSGLLGGKKSAKLPAGFALDSQTNEYTMDVWMRQGFIPWRGDRLNIYAITQGLRAKFADDILTPVIKDIWGTTDFLAGMIVAGGGMSIIGREILEQHIFCKIYMAADPSLSIVRGYFRYAATQVVAKPEAVTN
ncbi:TPA: ParM/StbA family protein [Pseudomonas aeruginosa]|nr:ParM/StbA family protein [Pseudomonas aeruginosa]